MEFDPRFKLNVFEGETTYTNDFRKYSPQERKKHSWPKDKSEKPPKPCPHYKPKDIQTLTPFREGVTLPFNTLWEPRPIIETNPRDGFKQMEAPIDTEKADVMKTRPRLYVSPAVSMDDVPDPEMRRLMCRHMYSTEWEKFAREAAMPTTVRDVPKTTLEPAGNILKFQSELYPPLPKGWRERGKAWDLIQTRGCVDPTHTFWINKDPPVKCGACVDPLKGLVKDDTKAEIARLIKENNLKQIHDKICPTFAGFKARLTDGIPLERKSVSVVHPK